MTDLDALKAANAKRWVAATVTRDATAPARRLVAAKPRYHAVAATTGVPWFAIAVIHEREAAQRWDTQLGQGDPLAHVSVHVPKGRGPFATWEAGAVDALVNCAPYAARWRDWSAGGLLTLLEQYNGLGYAGGPVTRRNGVVIARFPPQASPYIWDGTDQYHAGKYVSDGEFDPNVVDKQLGCAGLLKAMMALDPTITFTGLRIVPPKAAPAGPPSITNPAKGSIGAFVASLLAALLGRKP